MGSNKCFFLVNTEQPLISYITKVSILTVILGAGVALLLGHYFPNSSPPVFDITTHNIVGAIFFAPVIETFLMIPIIVILNKITSNEAYIALISAVFWGGVHSLQSPLWGIGVFILFYIISIAYQCWNDYSKGHALLVVMLIHAINNTSMLFLMLIQDYV